MPPFAPVPPEILCDPSVNDGDVRVYAALLTFADYGTGKNCHPSLPGLAERCGKDRSTVIRSVARLMASGWVGKRQRTTRDGDSDTNEYYFPKQLFATEVVAPAPPRSGANATTWSRQRDGGSGASATGVVAPAPPDREPSTESHLPKEDHPPAEDVATLLTMLEEKKPKEPNLKQLQAIEKEHKGKIVRKAWDEIMLSQPAIGRPTKKEWIVLRGVLAAALDYAHGEETLRDVLFFANEDDYLSGRQNNSGTKDALAFFARRNWSTVCQKYANAHPDEDEPEPNTPPAHTPEPEEPDPFDGLDACPICHCLVPEAQAVPEGCNSCRGAQAHA